jgi:HJR/Mrr/RecB family endonuclease
LFDHQKYIRIAQTRDAREKEERDRPRRELEKKIELRKNEIAIAKWFAAREVNTNIPYLNTWMKDPAESWKLFKDSHWPRDKYQYVGAWLRNTVFRSRYGLWLHLDEAVGIDCEYDELRENPDFFFDPNLPTFAEWLADPNGCKERWDAGREARIARDEDLWEAGREEREAKEKAKQGAENLWRNYVESSAATPEERWQYVNDVPTYKLVGWKFSDGIVRRPSLEEWLRNPDGWWKCFLDWRVTYEARNGEFARKFLEQMKFFDNDVECKKRKLKPKSEPKKCTIDLLRTMQPTEFETAVANMFRKRGYTVTQTVATGDGGRDLVMIKDERKVLVECKRYAEGQYIGRPDIQKFHSAIMTDRAECGFFVTTSGFSRQAMQYVQQRCIPITLIEGATLVQMMNGLL